MQWKALSQGSEVLGHRTEWGGLDWASPGHTLPTRISSPDTERLVALARRSSKRQHPSQRWGWYIKAASNYRGPRPVLLQSPEPWLSRMDPESH